MNIFHCVLSLIELFPKAWNKWIRSPFICKAIAECGKNVRIGRGTRISGRRHMHIGNRVCIGENNVFLCTRADVIIRNHVMLGPNVTVITGDHKIDICGKNMIDVTDAEKCLEDDLPVIFEGDNWVGAHSVILKGVVIGKGAVIAAGAVVTKDIPAYAVAGGVPAQVLKYRFTPEQIEKHEEILRIESNPKRK